MPSGVAKNYKKLITVLKQMSLILHCYQFYKAWNFSFWHLT